MSPSSLRLNRDRKRGGANTTYRTIFNASVGLSVVAYEEHSTFDDRPCFYEYDIRSYANSHSTQKHLILLNLFFFSEAGLSVAWK